MRFEVGDRVRNLPNLHTGEIIEVRHYKGAPPRYTVDFGYEKKVMEEIDLEAAEVDLHSPEHQETLYQHHLAREHWGEDDYEDDPSHPDGCYWCGSCNHPSDVCVHQEDFYEE